MANASPSPTFPPTNPNGVQFAVASQSFLGASRLPHSPFLASPQIYQPASVQRTSQFSYLGIAPRASHLPLTPPLESAAFPQAAALKTELSPPSLVAPLPLVRSTQTNQSGSSPPAIPLSLAPPPPPPLPQPVHRDAMALLMSIATDSLESKRPRRTDAPLPHIHTATSRVDGPRTSSFLSPGRTRPSDSDADVPAGLLARMAVSARAGTAPHSAAFKANAARRQVRHDQERVYDDDEVSDGRGGDEDRDDAASEEETDEQRPSAAGFRMSKKSKARTASEAAAVEVDENLRRSGRARRPKRHDDDFEVGDAAAGNDDDGEEDEAADSDGGVANAKAHKRRVRRRTDASDHPRTASYVVDHEAYSSADHPSAGNRSQQQRRQPEDESDDQDDQTQYHSDGRKRRPNFSRSSRDLLQQWLNEHIDYPYPNDDEKAALSAECGITHEQICNWFVNARMRYTKRFGAKGGKRAAASLKGAGM